MLHDLSVSILGKDSCAGDSGGPLMINSRKKARPVQTVIGIVSWGDTLCGKKDAPALYTNVTHFMRWILDNIEE